jgi:hypothetical protein
VPLAEGAFPRARRQAGLNEARFRRVLATDERRFARIVSLSVKRGMREESPSRDMYSIGFELVVTAGLFLLASLKTD